MRKPKETLTVKEAQEVIATLTIRRPLIGTDLEDFLMGLRHYLQVLEMDFAAPPNGRRYRELPIYHFGRRQLVHVPPAWVPAKASD